MRCHNRRGFRRGYAVSGLQEGSFHHQPQTLYDLPFVCRNLGGLLFAAHLLQFTQRLFPRTSIISSIEKPRCACARGSTIHGHDATANW